MQFYTAADQVAVGKVQLSTLFSQLTAKELILQTLSGASGARFGDSNVGATRGVNLPASVGPTVLRTSVADERDKIDLTLAYIYVPAGSTLTITIGC